MRVHRLRYALTGTVLVLIAVLAYVPLRGASWNFSVPSGDSVASSVYAGLCFALVAGPIGLLAGRFVRVVAKRAPAVLSGMIIGALVIALCVSLANYFQDDVNAIGVAVTLFGLFFYLLVAQPEPDDG